MTSKEITIGEKKARVAYCYAVELMFKKYTGEVIENFDASNPEQVMYLVLSAIIAYSSAKNIEQDVKDEDIMYNAQPRQLIDAVKAIVELRMEWYSVPGDEKKKKGQQEGK